MSFNSITPEEINQHLSTLKETDVLNYFEWADPMTEALRSLIAKKKQEALEETIQQTNALFKKKIQAYQENEHDVSVGQIDEKIKDLDKNIRKLKENIIDKIHEFNPESRFFQTFITLYFGLRYMSKKKEEIPLELQLDGVERAFLIPHDQITGKGIVEKALFDSIYSDVYKIRAIQKEQRDLEFVKTRKLFSLEKLEGEDPRSLLSPEDLVQVETVKKLCEQNIIQIHKSVIAQAVLMTKEALLNHANPLLNRLGKLIATLDQLSEAKKNLEINRNWLTNIFDKISLKQKIKKAHQISALNTALISCSCIGLLTIGAVVGASSVFTTGILAAIIGGAGIISVAGFLGRYRVGRSYENLLSETKIILESDPVHKTSMQQLKQEKTEAKSRILKFEQSILKLESDIQVLRNTKGYKISDSSSSPLFIRTPQPPVPETSDQKHFPRL